MWWGKNVPIIANLRSPDAPLSMGSTIYTIDNLPCGVFMTTDLICLIVLALWSIPLNHLPAIGRASSAGLEWAMGNRETTPEAAPWVGRADRAQRNHHDNLAAIATIILVAYTTGQTDEVTAIASIVVVSGRILHTIAYISGISLLRSLAYFAAIIALLTIVWRIFAG